MSEHDETTTQPQSTELPRVTARVDVFESDDHYLVRADVPGVAKDHVDIRFHDGRLSFEGTAESELIYARTVGFGDDVDPDAIEATLERGVLQLQLGKVAAKKPRRIAIGA